MNQILLRPVALRRTAIAAALAVASVWPAMAAIVTSGVVSPDPSGGTVNGFLNIGQTGVGSVIVNGGSVLVTQRLGLANLAGQANTGDGTLIVTGVGSRVLATAADNGNIDIGGLGKGSVSLLAGGQFSYGNSSDACKLGCSLKVSESAGSTGNFLISGAGSSFDTVGSVVVGQSLLWRVATGDTLDYGSIGGAAKGTMTVEAGGQATSSALTIGNPGSGTWPRTTESATGQVVVDGIGSSWNIVRNSAQTGARAPLSLATGASTFGSLQITNGGLVKIDGTIAPSEQSGINVGGAAGANLANATGAITVNGAGSRLEIASGTGGFINLGRGVGVVASLDVQNGGVVTGVGADGLAFLSVGRGGATATLNVSGAGSLLRLAGTDAFGSGAFLHVGRFDTGAAGTGTVNISNGGRVEIDNGNQVLTSNNQTGTIIGNTAGSVGSMTISGVGSELRISGSTGKTPFIGVGRDGGTGQLTIAAGGRLEVSSQHLSAPSVGAYLNGEASLFNIGQRVAGADGLASTGTVTVTGAGSELVMSGSADRLIQLGNGTDATGTLNITQGGKVVSSALLVGNGATGTLNMSAGTLLLDGIRNGGPGAGGGAGMGVGRAGGTGVATIGNGSTILITPTGPDGGLTVGGSTLAPGGTGTLLLSGGSTITINGPNAAATVGSEGTSTSASIGTMVLSGAGTSLSINGSGARVLVGNHANAVGTMIVGQGSSVTTNGLIGLGHNGTSSTGGSGVLCVNGVATAADLIIGAGGVLCGSGVVNANVVNQGLVTPGNSPGTLTINGAFDNSGGKIVLEVQDLGNGQFAMDELVFVDWSQVTMGGVIEFVFLGSTNPTDFQDAGLFELGSFFKQVGAGGQAVALDDSQLGLFSGVTFEASADQVTLLNFNFDPVTGATFVVVSQVPLPAPLGLLLSGLALLGLQRRSASRTSMARSAAVGGSGVA